MEVPIRNESNAFLKSEIILLHYVVVRLVLFDFFLAHTCRRTESSNCSTLDVDDSHALLLTRIAMMDGLRYISMEVFRSTKWVPLC
jgi:hypothetical protein